MKGLILTAAAAVLSTAAVAAAPVALPPAPAPGTALPKGQCFRTQDMRNHTVVDNRTLLVEVNHQTYRVTMSGACLAGAVSSDPIITRQPPGLAIVCKPIDLDITVSRSGGPSACIVSAIDRLTPEQVAALPRRLKP